MGKIPSSGRMDGYNTREIHTWHHLCSSQWFQPEFVQGDQCSPRRSSTACLGKGHHRALCSQALIDYYCFPLWGTLSEISLHPELTDEVRWRWTASGQCSARSACRFHFNGAADFPALATNLEDISTNTLNPLVMRSTLKTRNDCVFNQGQPLTEALIDKWRLAVLSLVLVPMVVGSISSGG